MPDTTRSLVRAFLNDERGITDETLEDYGVYDDGEWLCFPYLGMGGEELYLKCRKHDSEGKRHFRSPTGVQPRLFRRQSTDLEYSDTAFLVEGESDCLRLSQELKASGSGSSSDCHVYAIPGVNGWRDEFRALFDKYERIYVILDNDEDYKVAATVDRCWMSIKASLGRKAHRIHLPDGVNDLCDFFDSYNISALRELIERAKEPKGSWHYKALDLTKPHTEPDWLVDGLIANGDLCMLIGEPGIGKSWITMALAVAIAGGSESFLGRNLNWGQLSGNRVLYVDEENPEVLIPYRLRKLGLTDEGIRNIRYLHQQGVRVDRHPDYILEEALDYDPVLIVLDSLTRLHTKDENNAGEISALFNDGIVPLARTTGATVVLLHHVNKTDSSSSFARARGSSDLSGVIDTGLDLRGTPGNPNLVLHHYKSRWGEGGKIDLRIDDTSDGGVALTVRKPSF